MRKLRFLISLILIIVMISCGIFSGSAYQYVSYSYSPEGVKVLYDNTGVFLASADGSYLYIEKLAPELFSRTLSLPYPISDYHISMGQASAICVDVLNRQTIIFYYDIEKDYLDSFSLFEAGVSTEIGYASDHAGIYLRDSSPNVISRYSYSGKREYRYEFAATVTCITQDSSGAVYAIANNLLYRLNPNGITTLSGDAVYRYVRFLSEDMLIDIQGNIYSISSGAAEKRFGSENTGCFGTVVGDSCYLAAENTVTRYTLSGEKTGYFSFDSPVISILSDGDKIVVLTDEGGIRVNYLSDSEIIAVNNRRDSDDEDAVGSAVNHAISSDFYRIDYDKKMIYAIPAGTTVSQWKSHMSYDGYSLTLYRDNTVRKSGNVATAMMADFSSNERLSFELCVSGDLTGEGNVNAKDRKALIDYLLGSRSLSGAYLYAGDINNDGSIDLLDAVKICQMTE